jgi:hypothetical protein
MISMPPAEIAVSRTSAKLMSSWTADRTASREPTRGEVNAALLAFLAE